MATDLTTALGRLLTDHQLRRDFRADPLGVAQQLNVEEQQRAALVSLCPDALELQAQLLIEKRMHEAARWLPGTFARLGGRASAYFMAYAKTFWPEGHRRHLNDAASFGRYLIEHAPAAICRSEFNQVDFIAQERRFGCRWVPDALVGGRSRRALEILYRRRSIPRRLVIYLGLK